VLKYGDPLSNFAFSFNIRPYGMAPEDFEKIHDLPFPMKMAEDESGEFHYKPFADVYGTVTTEADMPSLKASKEVDKRETRKGMWQGLTLVHFSAQLEPSLTDKSTPHTPNASSHPLNTGYTILTRTPYPIRSAQVELKSGRV